MPCKGGAESLYSTFVLSTIREWGFPARHKETHMPHKGPHISIAPDFVVNRILRINLEDFADWPESVRHLATEIAEELFLVAYNPFVDSATVKASCERTLRSGSVCPGAPLCEHHRRRHHPVLERA